MQRVESWRGQSGRLQLRNVPREGPGDRPRSVILLPYLPLEAQWRQGQCCSHQPCPHSLGPTEGVSDSRQCCAFCHLGLIETPLSLLDRDHHTSMTPPGSCPVQRQLASRHGTHRMHSKHSTHTRQSSYSNIVHTANCTHQQSIHSTYST